ncbi:MAG: hypothetical protein R2883_02795 [Caldisericia bacterium]
MENSGQKFFKETSYISTSQEPRVIEEPMVDNPESTHEPIQLERPKFDDVLSKTCGFEKKQKKLQ